MDLKYIWGEEDERRWTKMKFTIYASSHNLRVVSQFMCRLHILRWFLFFFRIYKIYFEMKYIWGGEDDIYNLCVVSIFWDDFYFPLEIIKYILRYRMKKYIWGGEDEWRWDSQFTCRLHILRWFLFHFRIYKIYFEMRNIFKEKKMIFTIYVSSKKTEMISISL